jgi:hypothetical protein
MLPMSRRAKYLIQSFQPSCAAPSWQTGAHTLASANDAFAHRAPRYLGGARRILNTSTGRVVRSHPMTSSPHRTGNATVNDSAWLTHELVMDAIKRGTARRMRSYANEADRHGAHGLASDLRRWAHDRDIERY